MANSEQDPINGKICPRCGATVPRADSLADVLDRYDCPECHCHFVDVCQGACNECANADISCGDCSWCMNERLPDYYESTMADDLVSERSGTPRYLRLRNGDYKLYRRVFIVIDGQRHELTVDINSIL